MTDEKMIQLLMKLDARLGGIENNIDAMKDELRFVKNTVIHIEEEHGRKLTALFDAYQTNYEIGSENRARLDQLEPRVDNLSMDVAFLKARK